MSVREKLVGVICGPVAVNGNAIAASGTASFKMVIVAGKMTAAADSDRSWLPPEPSRSIKRVWNGEPVMAAAEFPKPQSMRVAI